MENEQGLHRLNIGIPALCLTGCVTLGRQHDLSEPQFHHSHHWRQYQSPCRGDYRVAVTIKWDNTCKPLTQEAILGRATQTNVNAPSRWEASLCLHLSQCKQPYSPPICRESRLFWELRDFCPLCILTPLRCFFPGLGWFPYTHYRNVRLLKRGCHSLYRHTGQTH